MRLLFCTSKKPGSLLIRAFTWSSWSHVALVDGDEVIEAVWPRVRVAPLQLVLTRHSAYAFVDLPARSADRIVKAARAQVGKPYDWTALVGMVVRRDWQEGDSWFCSELVAWSLAQGGSPLFRPDVMHRVTPEHLWMLAPESVTDVLAGKGPRRLRNL